MQDKKVLVAMSGGVDSSAVAYILKNEGYDIAGATMLLIDDNKSKKSIIDAKKICSSLKIKHYVFDLTKEFREIVINDFIENYKKALTPNPCVVCNKHFKFGLFFEKAKELGYNFIATGHYAAIENHKLKQASNEAKDQTYFLYGIPKNILDNILFPLSKYESKDIIRNIARKINIDISQKKDSQEICFIENDDYKSFLNKNYNQTPSSGNICLENKEIIGKHQGLYNYTIGQRKGLNISYKNPLYVTKIDTKTNTLFVGDNNDLFKDELLAGNINLLVERLPKEVYAKIRSRAKEEKATISQLSNGKLKVKFISKQRAITPGQSVVFYDKNKNCLGGGIIEDIF